MNNPPVPFTREDPWRIFRIMAEFVDSFEILSQCGPAVTIFGSARVSSNDPNYRTAVTLGKGFAKHNMAVITGGGPGIMEAANRGAHDVGAKSVGLNIALPMEQEPNHFISHELCFQFRYFAIRKFHFVLRAMALVVFPGGFGTMDELFEVLTLRQTGRMQHIPVILVGREYWNLVIDFAFLADEGVIADDDLKLFEFADTAEAAWNIIREFHRL